jgi:single-strand DNA-binding protein
MNNVKLFGRIANLKQGTDRNGHSLCTFSIATREQWKEKSGERKERTTWHSCKVFGHLSKLTPHIEEGGRILVTGKLTYFKKEAYNICSIVVDEIEIIDFKRPQNEAN